MRIFLARQKQGKSLKVRLQRAAVPRPIGECFFVNDLTSDELVATLAAHREIAAGHPRSGGGEDMLTPVA